MFFTEPMQVADKVVLITGASEGIGAACVAAFRCRGAKLALVARSEDKLRALASGDDLVLPADLTVNGQRESVIARTIERFGRVDVLVNNAGAGLYIPSHRAANEDTRRLFELNFFAPLHLAQLAAADMKTRGTGAIINVSSVAGLVSLPWFTLYSATKHALCALTDGLRIELRGNGIHCMSVCPGYVRTQFQKNVLAGSVPPALGGLRQRWAITPERCAEDLVRGLERNAQTVVTPWSGWLLLAARWLTPGILEKRFEKMYLSGSSPS